MGLPSVPGISNSTNMVLSLSAEACLREQALLHQPLPSTSLTVSYDRTGSKSETTNDDKGFTTVRQRRPKQHGNSSNRDSTDIIASLLLFCLSLSSLASISVSTYNTIKLRRCLDSLVPGQITEIRLDKRKNVITVDTACAGACDMLL